MKIHKTHFTQTKAMPWKVKQIVVKSQIKKKDKNKKKLARTTSN